MAQAPPIPSATPTTRMVLVVLVLGVVCERWWLW